MNFEDLSLRDIELLQEVAAAGSVRQVATHRNIAQPALSRKIQNMERCLGAPLFSRNRKGVQITAFGKLALQMLGSWRSDGLLTGRKIADSINLHSIIRLGTYDSVAIYSFPRLLKAVEAKNLNCSLELHLGRSREIMRQVADGIIDAGLVFCGGARPANLKINHVAKDEYGFFESTTGRTSEDFYSLASSSAEDGTTIVEFLQSFGLQHQRVVSTPSFEVASALTLSGLGIGILPVRVARAHVQQRKLRPLTIGKITTFGAHNLSFVRHMKNKDRTLEDLVKIVEALG